MFFLSLKTGEVSNVWNLRVKIEDDHWNMGMNMYIHPGTRTRKGQSSKKVVKIDFPIPWFCLCKE